MVLGKLSSQGVLALGLRLYPAWGLAWLLCLQDGQSVTLEPGGQFELSGGILDSLHKTCAEVNSHLYQVRPVVAEPNIFSKACNSRLLGGK